MFKSRRSIDWDEIEQILRKFIGEYYEIAETAEKVYIGSDFPDEFTHSKYTKAIKGANKKRKRVRRLSKNCTVTVFDFKAFLNMAMLLAESENAKILRQILLDLMIMIN